MEQLLRARLQAALPGTPVEWGWNGQGVATPRIVLQIVSGVPTYTYSGPSGFEQSRVQIDIYAPTYKAVKDTFGALDASLSGWRSGLIVGVFRDARRDMQPDFGAGETLARISADYMIHHNME